MILDSDLNNRREDNINYFNELPLILTSMELFFPEGNSFKSPSHHDSYELTYVSSGEVNYYIAGKKLNLKAGSTIVVWPGVDHTYEVLGECEVICVYFSMNSDDIFNQNNLDSKYKRNRKVSDVNEKENKDQSKLGLQNEYLDTELEDYKLPEYEIQQLVLKGQSKYQIANIVENIIIENKLQMFGKSPMLQALALQLTVQLNRALQDQLEQERRIKEGSVDELLDIIEDFINENYTLNISVGDMAEHVFLSEGYFTRAFKERLGTSPMNYLIKFRVEKSKELLQKTDLKINNISREVGFTSTQRFNSAFKKILGITPSEYRKSFVSEKQNLD
ncbi:AraC family transcriptional regulator [Fastidiosipila sanguinis]|uniref:HTH araC/xylS-type domain-containing protein n=1 Tax=Fastidiosipila sanguinis TaxID=236753 RepID=A0A2S0KNL1_9FIRM|nr:AraC family transcriptional regulator [Fastidiosipila sanguinis]AVM42622.1 hypothetical protein C5Q98_05080 [Fastidiosipila sanguinis]